MIELNHSPYLSQYKVTIVAEELLFKNHRLLILMCQTRALRTGVPKSTMLLFLLVLVCPSLSWRINSSPALSKMTTTSSLEISTGREHCQTTSCTEEGLFPEGGPDRMTGWHYLLCAGLHNFRLVLISKFSPKNLSSKRVRCVFGDIREKMP